MMFVEFVASGLKPREHSRAINFAFRAAVRLDICKEAAVKSEKVILRLYEFPDPELLEALEDLGFRHVN